MPDILSVTTTGRMVCVEIKRPTARKRDNEAAQRAMLDWLEARGALVIRRATCVEDVAAALGEA